jgi:adenosylmethionine-8-amino-7-oxononanoate aminotransferase
MPQPSRAELEHWDRQHVWHPFTQMAEYEPFIIERAEGCVLVDVNGRQYLDGVSSLWCNVHGHKHARLNEAIHRQLERVAHTTLLGASNTTTIELAKRLVEITPSGLDHVFFSDNGATAVEVALKMAFQYWQQRVDPRPGKTRFVALSDAYHGDTLGAVSVGGVERFRRMFHPLLFDALRLPAPDASRPPDACAAERVLEYYLRGAEALFSSRHHEIAAFVIEPLVQAAAGMIVHPAGYLRQIRDLTRRYDILLIADEVAVGMGRTGSLFACERENVVPDFLCLAKGLTGGYLPLAATLTTTEIFRAFLGAHADQKAFCHGHTYGGNPLGAAVALATLDIFREERTLEKLPAKVERLKVYLQRLACGAHVRSARHCGLMAGIELTHDKLADEPYPWQERRGQRVCRHALEEGVWLRPLGDVVVVMPPLVISLEELDQILRAVERGIEVATRDP